MSDGIPTAGGIIRGRLDEFESQAVFRLLLDALARPGVIVELPDRLVGRVPNALVPLLALLGHDTTFNIVGDESGDLTALVRHVTGGRPSPIIEATFVAVTRLGDEFNLSQVAPGTRLRPDLAAQVAISFRGRLSSTVSDERSVAHRVCITLSGPGVPDERRIFLEGEVSELLDVFESRRSTPEAGVDVWIFDAVGNIVGVPRTTHLEVVDTFVRHTGGN